MIRKIEANVATASMVEGREPWDDIWHTIEVFQEGLDYGSGESPELTLDCYLDRAMEDAVGNVERDGSRIRFLDCDRELLAEVSYRITEEVEE